MNKLERCIEIFEDNSHNKPIAVIIEKDEILILGNKGARHTFKGTNLDNWNEIHLNKNWKNEVVENDKTI